MSQLRLTDGAPMDAIRREVVVSPKELKRTQSSIENALRSYSARSGAHRPSVDALKLIAVLALLSSAPAWPSSSVPVRVPFCSPFASAAVVPLASPRRQ